MCTHATSGVCTVWLVQVINRILDKVFTYSKKCYKINV